MNDKELQKVRNENLKKINRDDWKNRNKVNIHPQNSKAHERKKFELCWNLEKKNKHYITEARFKDKHLRADIYVLDDDELWEIETSKRELADRKSLYPKDGTYIFPLWDESPEVITLYDERF